MTTMLRAASEQTKRLQSRGLRAGGNTRPPILTVARWTHAYEDDSEATLCGLDVESLHWEEFRELAFATVNPNLCCRECLSLAGIVAG